MKKSLLATTAIAALGAVAVASPASAKFEVGVSGYMEQWFGYSDNANNAQPNSDVFDIMSDVEFNIDFKQTLDNGLTIGGQIQVEGQQQAEAAASDIDEQYIFIDGSFGRLLIGSENGAPYLMHYGIASNGIGIDEGDVKDWVAGASTALRRTSQTTEIDNDQNKITYFSPRVNGFQIGATFVPSQDINLDTPQTGGDEVDGTRDSGWGVAGNYVTSVADMSIKASIGFMDAGGGVPGNQTALSAGLNVGFGGFTASFAYGEHENDGGPSDQNLFGVGLGYKAGPAGVSIGYIRGEDSDTDDQQDALEIGASYAMGPGVTAKGSIYYVDRVLAGNQQADGIAVVGGLALNF
jgi:outer membrane protein OmpU